MDYLYPIELHTTVRVFLKVTSKVRHLDYLHRQLEIVGQDCRSIFYMNF